MIFNTTRKYIPVGVGLRTFSTGRTGLRVFKDRIAAANLSPEKLAVAEQRIVDYNAALDDIHRKYPESEWGWEAFANEELFALLDTLLNAE